MAALAVAGALLALQVAQVEAETLQAFHRHKETMAGQMERNHRPMLLEAAVAQVALVLAAVAYQELAEMGQHLLFLEVP